MTDDLIARKSVIDEVTRFRGYLDEDMIFRLQTAIKRLPTVDAVPVRHGKWMLYYDIEQGRALRCSECKMVFWVGDGREGNFCPNCGARMDEE